MHAANQFLEALAMVLCVAAVTTVVFQRLRQPVVLGYLLAGLIVGPHLPIPLVADPEIVHALSELGVILLMFSLGLEFSLRKLAQVGPTSGLTAILESSLMVWLGYVAARGFGWTPREAIFAGAMVAISSTTIVARAFADQAIRGGLRELVFGILIVEDLVAILLLATLTAISSGTGLSAEAFAFTLGRLAAFLGGVLVVGLLVVPRMVRAVTRLRRPETTVVAAIGLCFGMALLAQASGYSVALGAFLAGSLVAESGEGKQVEHLIEPVRDMFGAVFFVSVGMLIDPGLIAAHWTAVLGLAGIVLVGKFTGVTIGAFLVGNSARTSVQAGMSLAQIGEFSFIIAGLGLSLGATRDFLYPIAVAVSALTTLTTPWLIRGAEPIANWIDRKLPRPLQTFAALYGSWVESLRASGRRASDGARIRRAIRLILGDTLLLAAIIIGTSLGVGPATRAIAAEIDVDARLIHWGLIAMGALLAAPFFLGIVRLAQWLGPALAARALPPAEAGVDFGVAPRRALTLTLQLGIFLVVGAPLVALTQPFVPDFVGAALLLGVLLVLGVAFWRSATNLQGHVRAGAEAVMETLAHTARAATPRTGEAEDPDSLADVRELLPGIGKPVSARVPPGSVAVGHSLSQLNLRGRTGATVLAIRRQDGTVHLPTAHEVLGEGDVLALAGTQEAIAAARAVLAETPDPALAREEDLARPG